MAAGSSGLTTAGATSTSSGGAGASVAAGSGASASAGSSAPAAAGSGTATSTGGSKAVATAGSSASAAGASAAAGTLAAAGSGAGGSAAAGSGGGGEALAPFSFFITSYAAIQRLSGGPEGFGGDLRFGQADGLSGADEICRTIAETSMPGSSSKTWRAFLSVTKDASGNPVNAIDRVGDGPWYDRRGRLIAMNKADLAQTRPKGADTAIINDLPNEDGVPNHAPDGMQVDNHDMLTGSNATGQLYSTNWSSTCHDWTSSTGSDGKPRCGHAWPRSGGGGGRDRGGSTGSGMGGMDNWMSALDEAGCGKGASLVEMGPPDASNPTVGSGGGYGGFYCFALKP